MAECWEAIKLQAEVSPGEDAILSLCDLEDNGEVLFVRIPIGLDFPAPMWGRLVDASIAHGLILKAKARWRTVNDLQAVVSDIDWLWENWIPKGLPSMLAGPSGIGKTTMLHHFIKVVVTGGAWPDGSRQQPGVAVFVETEGAQALVVKHFRDMGIPMDRVYIPSFDGDLLGQVDLRRRDHQALLRQLCGDVRPALIGIDSIGGSQSRGENHAEEARPIMQFLAALARDFRCGLIASHHLKKRGDGFENAPLNIDLVRGSTVFVAYTRSLLALSKQKGILKLEILKSNVARIGEPLAVKFNTNVACDVCSVSFEPLEPEKPTPTLVQRCADWIRTVLAPGKQSAKTMAEWADGAGFSHGTLFRGAQMLEDNGELVRVTYGKTTIWELVGINDSVTTDISVPVTRTIELLD